MICIGGCGNKRYPSRLTDPRHTSDREYEIFHVTYTFILVHIWKIVHLFNNTGQQISKFFCICDEYVINFSASMKLEKGHKKITWL